MTTDARTKRAPAPNATFDLDAVLRAIGGREFEIAFDKEGVVRVTRKSITPYAVGVGASVEAATRDLARQTLTASQKECSGLRASLDTATARHDALALLLGDAAETPSP